MRITLIVNPPEPDELETLRAEVERLRGEGHEVYPNLTFERGDARRLARSACLHGTSMLVAAGGDGTVNEVVNGIHDHLEEVASGGSERPEPPRMAIVPLGTANDLANDLGIAGDIAEAMRVALEGPEREVDIGLAGDRCFVNVSTGGLGAEATGEAGPEAKEALGPLAYLVTGVRKFVGLEASSARFRSDRVLYEGPFLVFAVGNGRRTGGGNLLTPRADPSDGLLDLCILKEISRIELLKLLPDLRSGEHLAHPAVIYHQVPHVAIEATSELSVNADGEPVPSRNLLYRVSRHRLRLAVPDARAADSG